MALIMTEEAYDEESTALMESWMHRPLQNDGNVGTSAVNAFEWGPYWQ
jgi:hypothetical protein